MCVPGTHKWGYRNAAGCKPALARVPSKAQPQLGVMVNKGHTVIKLAYLEIALSVAPRLNPMSEICTGIIKVMRFMILSAD